MPLNPVPNDISAILRTLPDNKTSCLADKADVSIVLYFEMSGMRQEINVLYRNTAEEFARKVVSTLGTRVHYIVLYGSVARLEARKGSDIDVLIIGAEPNLRDEVLDIAYSAMEELRFETLVNVVYLTRREIQELAQRGNPLVGNALEEGSILYDDGTVAELRQRIPARL